MVREIICAKICISNPSDMNQYRDKVEDVIKDYNEVFGYGNDIHFQVVHWGKDVTGQVAPDPQLAVNDQLFSEFDLMIAIFGARLGTDTPRARSGTEEEVRIAIDKCDTIFQKRHVQVLFKKNVSIDPSNFDYDQLKKINMFRKDIQGKALTIDFDDDRELEDKVKRFLEQARLSLAKWRSNKPAQEQAVTEFIETVNRQEAEPILPKPVIEDTGIFDEIENANQNFSEMAEVTNEYAGLLDELTSEISSLEIGKIDKSSFSEVKSAFDRFGELLESYSSRIALKVDKLSRLQSAATDHFDNVLILIDYIDPDERNKLRETIITTSSQINTFRSSVADGSSTLKAMPQSTQKFNRGRRSFLETNEALEQILEHLSNSFSEYIKYLE